MMKKTLLITALFAALFLSLAMVSAADPVLDFKINSIPATAVHNSEITINFNLTSTEDATISWSNSSEDSSKGYFITTPITTFINKSLNLLNLEARIKIPQYASGVFKGNINVSNGTSKSSLPITITINNTPSLSISAPPTTLNSLQSSTTITITNTGNVALSNIILNATNANGVNVNLSQTSFSLNPGNFTTALLTASNFGEILLGTNSAITVYATSLSPLLNASSISIQAQNSYCDSGDTPLPSNLTIKTVDISNQGDGDDYNWNPLDPIRIEVEVRNTNSNSDNKISTDVELELYSPDGKAYLKLEKVKIGKIEGGATESAIFNFIVPVDVEDGSYLYIKAYQDGKESSICTSRQPNGDYKRAIGISRETDEDKQVAVYDISFDSTPAICGTDTNLNFKVANIGDTDQRRVKVKVTSPLLGIDTYKVLTNLNEGDRAEQLSFPILISKNLEAKKYTDIQIKVYYEYSDDDDYEDTQDLAYENVRAYSTSLDVNGNYCKGSETKSASIAAELSSETPKAIIGNQVVVQATIKNLGITVANYTIDVTGNSAWSTATVDPKNIVLNAGESKTVNIYLDVSEDATEGDKEFTITSTSGVYVASQKVQIALEKGMTTQRILDSIKSNWIIYTIILVNLILIIAIIIVVRSLMNK